MSNRVNLAKDLVKELELKGIVLPNETVLIKQQLRLRADQRKTIKEVNKQIVANY